MWGQWHASLNDTPALGAAQSVKAGVEGWEAA